MEIEKGKVKEDFVKVSKEDVTYLAHLYGLPINKDDLQEITFRLSAMLNEITRLNELDISKEEPAPIFLEEGRI